MKYSKFQERAKKEDVHLLIDLGELEQFTRGNVLCVRDKRTVQKDNRFEVYPIALTEKQIFVVCPLCGHIHVHGLGDDVVHNDRCLPSGDFCNSKTADCSEGNYDIYLIIA